MNHPTTNKRPGIAHVVSRFPKLTETFVLYELVEQARRSIDVSLYALIRHRDPVIHPEAANLIRGTHYSAMLSFPVLGAAIHYALNRPGKLLRAAGEVLAGTFRSPRFFIRSVALLPKSIRFARAMERDGVSHIHAHFATHAATAALIAHRLTDIPFSFTARGSDVHVNRCMLREKVEAAAFVIAVSSHNREVIVEECGPAFQDRVHVVFGGIDTDTFSPRSGKDPSAPFTILCVSSFEEVKGHRYLVDACRILADRRLRYECYLVGAGPLLERIARKVEAAGLDDRIHLPGPGNRLEVVERFAAADVFALATAPTSSGRQEGIPNVLKEAMACELPVVASRAGGIPELVEHERSGLLVEPRDPEALADALERLAGNPELRRRMGSAGRERIVRDFDLAASVSRRTELFLGKA